LPSPSAPAATRTARFVGFAIPTTSEHVLVCGSEHGLFLYDTISKIATLAAETPTTTGEGGDGRAAAAAGVPRRLRFNDAKVDIHGRLFAGTMDMTEKGAIGGLFTATGDAIAAALSSRRQQGALPSASPLRRVAAVGDATISNGIDWCPCTKRMYYIDSPSRQVRFYGFHHETGAVDEAKDEPNTPKTEAVRNFAVGSNGTGRALCTLQEGWYPDGMCVDESGYLWVAVWNGGRVVRIDPGTGAIVGEVLVPNCKRVTSVCFGGARLAQLFITTAKGNDVNAAPDAGEAETAGGIFVASVGVCGAPFTPFAIRPRQRL
jgi:sugar lactone lactonase YvrE